MFLSEYKRKKFHLLSSHTWGIGCCIGHNSPHQIQRTPGQYNKYCYFDKCTYIDIWVQSRFLPLKSPFLPFCQISWSNLTLFVVPICLKTSSIAPSSSFWENTFFPWMPLHEKVFSSLQSLAKRNKKEKSLSFGFYQNCINWSHYCGCVKQTPIIVCFQ